MQLFWMELKKIFSWPILILLVFVNLLLYWLLFEYEIKYFPNGRPAGDFFKIEQQMIGKYGTDMDEAEYEDFALDYALDVDRANTYLQNDPEAAAVGITNYEELRNPGNAEQEKYDYRSLVLFDRDEDLFWELQARESLMDYYKHREIDLEASGLRKERFEQLLEEEKFEIYSDLVPLNFKNISVSMAIILIISVAVVISPIFLRDQVKAVVPLQYTSRTGRDVYKIKWLAGLVGTIIVTVALLAVYLGIYSTNDTASYFDQPLHTFVGFDSWYDLTFYQYILLAIVAIFVLAVLVGIISMAVSAIARSYIVLIGIQMVFIALMIILVSDVLVSNIINIWTEKWIPPLAYGLLIFFTVVCSFFVWRREWRRDVL